GGHLLDHFRDLGMWAGGNTHPNRFGARSTRKHGGDGEGGQQDTHVVLQGSDECMRLPLTPIESAFNRPHDKTTKRSRSRRREAKTFLPGRERGASIPRDRN